MPRELFYLMKRNGVCLRGCIGQQSHAELGAGSRWCASPVRFAELLSGSGHSFEQAVGMHFAMVPDAFDVFILHLAKSYSKIITLRPVFAQDGGATFDTDRSATKGV